MSISREALCRKYNFKDIRVATWRDPYSAYAPKPAHRPGAPIVAADAYQRAYIPKYRLIIPSPQIPQTTDDEDSDAGDAEPAPSGPTSAPAVVDPPADPQPGSTKETPVEAKLVPAESGPSSAALEDASATTTATTDTLEVDAVADTTSLPDLPSYDPVALDSLPSLDDILNGLDLGHPSTQEHNTSSAAKELTTAPADIPSLQNQKISSVEEFQAQDDSALLAEAAISRDEPPAIVLEMSSALDNTTLNEQPCEEIIAPVSEVDKVPAAILENDKGTDSHPATNDIDIAALLDTIPPPAPEVPIAAPADDIADLLDFVLGPSAATVDEPAPTDEPDLLPIAASLPALDDLLADVIDAAPRKAILPDLPLALEMPLADASSEPALDADLMALLDASLVPAPAVTSADVAPAAAPTTPVLDNVSLCSDDKHVSFAPDTPEPKETKRKKKAPKDKDAKKTKRRSSLVAAEKPAVGISKVSDELSSEHVATIAAITEVHTASSIEAAVQPADSLTSDAAVEAKEQQKSEAAETKIKSSGSATSKKSSSSKSKSTPKTIGLLAAGALLFGAGKSRSTKTSSKDKNKKKTLDSDKASAKNDSESPETARYADVDTPAAMPALEITPEDTPSAASVVDSTPIVAPIDDASTRNADDIVPELSPDILAGLGIILDGRPEAVSTSEPCPAPPLSPATLTKSVAQPLASAEDLADLVSDVLPEQAITPDNSTELLSIPHGADALPASDALIQTPSSPPTAAMSFDSALADLLDPLVAVKGGESTDIDSIDHLATVQQIDQDMAQADHFVEVPVIALDDLVVGRGTEVRAGLSDEQTTNTITVSTFQSAEDPLTSTHTPDVVPDDDSGVMEPRKADEFDVSSPVADPSLDVLEDLDCQALAQPEPITMPADAGDIEVRRAVSGDETYPAGGPHLTQLHIECQDILADQPVPFGILDMYEAMESQQEPEEISTDATIVAAAHLTADTVPAEASTTLEPLDVDIDNGEIPQVVQLPVATDPQHEPDGLYSSAHGHDQTTEHLADFPVITEMPKSTSDVDSPVLAIKTELEDGSNSIPAAHTDHGIEEARIGLRPAPTLSPVTDTEAVFATVPVDRETSIGTPDTAEVREKDVSPPSESDVQLQSPQNAPAEQEEHGKISEHIDLGEAVVVEVVPEAVTPSLPTRTERSPGRDLQPSGLVDAAVNVAPSVRSQPGARRRRHRSSHEISQADDDEERRRRRRARRAAEEATMTIESQSAMADERQRSHRHRSHREHDYDRSVRTSERSHRPRSSKSENEPRETEPFKTQIIVPTLLRAFTGSSISSRDALTINTKPKEHRSRKSEYATSPTSTRSHRRERRDSVISKKTSPVIPEVPETSINEGVTQSELLGDQVEGEVASRVEDRERRRRRRHRESESQQSDQVREDVRAERHRSSRASDDSRGRRTTDMAPSKPSASSSSRGILSFFGKAR